ncbi:ABC transporter ATP-binding protein [Daejeonella lutea]|uniref:ATP-binding cassette, subfamily B, MsbA n=1 Tax=Daejeonella lutea TaxID=572036 RepID=A0A1T5DE17_9SPHI|nr:ABC transporter ATP-binding protein [Daejeonella lutea]SKB69988.1 ATP-binding cassette, subfamily B, MsbA [Daejeonella lutea]
MKTFLRLFSFAAPVRNFAIPFFITSILGVIFGLLNFTLLKPVFDLLFNQTAEVASQAPATAPVFDFNLSYFTEMFYFHFQSIIEQSGKLEALKWVCIAIVISVILSNLFKYLSARIIEDFRLRIVTNIRSAIFKKLTEIDLQYFNTQRKGDLISRFMTDVVTIQDSIIRSLQVILREPIDITLKFAVLFIISSKLTVFALILIPVSGLLITTIVKRLKKHAKAAQESLGILVSTIDEGIGGVKVIKSFNAEGYMQEKFNNINMWTSKIHRRLARRVLLASPVSEMMGVITVACLLFYGGTLILEEGADLSGSEFIVYIILFSQIIPPAKAISEAFGNITQGVSAGERIYQLLDAPENITDKPDTLSKSSFEDEIDVKNVSFYYDKKAILKNINVTIKKGETLALVGPSGGGKSTLLDLFPRFMDPKSGKITIDGTDIKNIRMSDVRALMGIVNQEALLFNDTIFNNIAFGRAVTEEEVIAAAKIANAHEFIINTEEAYQTNIGDRGMKLSGGQKQRICIARAVIANPSILLLDEATSALDTKSEKLVQEALSKLMKNRTTIVIAHRLSTIKNADKILVLDQGEIAESGSHKDLVKLDGLYSKLIAMQGIIKSDDE